MKKVAVGFTVLLVACAFLLAGAANAADFPKKRVTYNICFNPGGESDITARLQEQALKKYLGKDVSIQYKIGGGGAVCWAELVKTAPDGYTIAGHNLPHTILQPMEMGDAGYKTFDLKQVYMFEVTPNVLMVRKDAPYNTLEATYWRYESRLRHLEACIAGRVPDTAAPDDPCFARVENRVIARLNVSKVAHVAFLVVRTGVLVTAWVVVTTGAHAVA